MCNNEITINFCKDDNFMDCQTTVEKIMFLFCMPSFHRNDAECNGNRKTING